MKCPYRITTIHQRYIESSDYFVLDTPAQDMETFGECYGDECPFYDEENYAMKCARAWAEIWDGD